MEIKGTNVNLNPKVKEDSQIGKSLAKEIMLFADKNSSAVSKSEFQEKLNKMETLSPQELIKFIRSFDKDESIIELIIDEVGSDKNERKDACRKVLSTLTNVADKLGIDTKDFKQQFETELDHQFNSWGTVNTEKLDKIINALTQSIENRQNFTAEDVARVKNTSAAEGQEQANRVIENRLEKAYSAFGERVGEDGEMTTKDKDGTIYNGQMQRDGIAADIADGVSRIWGSKNTAAKVRKDLKATNEQLQQLQEAKLQGEEAYNGKFKEIFGVEYDYANILAYQKAEATYINASANREFELLFNRTFKALISPAPLSDEFQTISTDGVHINQITATKEQVYSREFNNLAKFLTQKDSNGNEIKGSEILNAAFKEKGVANGTMKEKFEVLKQIAKAFSKELHTATLEAGDGKEFSEVQAMYDNSYKAAYGVENDIMKRVTDYNVSQEVGGALVKMGAVTATTLATAGFGGGLVTAAATASIATVGYEVIDRGTSGKALNALREQGLGEYLDVVNEDIDWEATLKQAAMSGVAVLIGGGVAKGVTAIMKGSSSVAQFAAMLGADVITDATMELFTTKQITWQNMVFTVLLSTIGNAVQLNQMKNAADATKSADVAMDGARTNIATGADVDVKTKLANAGFTAKSSVTTVGNKCILPQNMKYDSGNIGDVTVKVASGDMTAVKADAYLVPEFRACASEGGVGAAIRRNGGGKGLEAYGNIIKTQGKQDFGTVHITESGGGNSQKLIHAVTVGSGAENEFKVVQKAVYNALKSAEEQGLSSVAMPALGTGIIGNLTNEQSAQAMMSAIRQFSNKGGQMDVTFVIYGSPKGYDGFVNTMKTGSYTSAVPTVGAREFDQARFLMGLANDGTDVDATIMAKKASTDVVANVPVSSSTGIVQTNTLDLSAGMKVSDIDNFMLQCQAYANKNGLTVEVGKHNVFKDPVITFKDGSGNPVRELHYIGSELFDDTMITYNTTGQIVNKTRYTASDGRFADNIQYFYDANGNITHSTKMSKPDQIDVAVYTNGKGMRQGPGVFFTQIEAKAKFGIDVDASMVGTTNSSAAVKPVTGDVPTMPTIDDIATVLVDLPVTSGATEAQLSQIRKAARTSKYDSNIVLDMMQKYPDVVDKLTIFKAPDGSQLFSAQDISDILFNCKQTIETNPEKIFAILNNPKEIADIADWKSRSAGVWRAIQDPLQSTVDINPAVFGVKPKVTATAGGTDFASKLADIKGPDGQPFLSKADIDNLLKNQAGLSGKPIPDFEARIMAVLSNPEEIASLADWKSRSAGVWRAIQDPLQSTVDANPATFKGMIEPERLLKPQAADNIKGQGISFKQAAGQPDYSATRIEWGRTVEETIALNKKNGVNLELVKGDDGQYFLGIKDIWSDGYHRVDRNAVVMHYGDYAPTPENYVAANPEWVKANANPDGTVKDCAVVANDKGAKILENSYVTADGQKIDFATMAPGTKVHKDPNAVVNAVAYDSPKTLHTLEGDITTDITMGDVDGNVYNNFKQLKKQITKGQLVANDADPYSARFIELVKAGQDDEAIALLKQATKDRTVKITSFNQRYCEPIKLEDLDKSSPLDVQDDIIYNDKYGNKYVTSYKYEYNGKVYSKELVSSFPLSKDEVENLIQAAIRKNSYN